MTTQALGLSGLAAYLPPYRVNLQDWCDWTGDNWDKVSTVIGRSFRMRGPRENVYTMAATAVMRLIRQYDINPAEVGLLALGTESSTDNAAGAVIVKGMVNEGLAAEGRTPLARNCEVPEIKHACLGGIYALKSALRYLACDGRGRKAIVVSADIAEYARGSSGEPTQGAGAVAMLVEAEPRLLEVDLHRGGSASDYRGPDFRKPFARFAGQSAPLGTPLKDFPVFNGKYSTSCYVDEVLLAMEDMFQRQPQTQRQALLDGQTAVFLHRPYQRMAETGYGMAYLYALATDPSAETTLFEQLCDSAGTSSDAVRAELNQHPRLFLLVNDACLDTEVYPLSMQVLRTFRKHPHYAEHVAARLTWGADIMKDAGNLYAAALPGWLAAGLEQAAATQPQLPGGPVLAIGYGSGDAAEVLPMRLVPGWQHAASRIAFGNAFADAVDLDKRSYEALHDNGTLPHQPEGSDFIISRVGDGQHPDFDDRGIEYYRFIAS